VDIIVFVGSSKGNKEEDEDEDVTRSYLRKKDFHVFLFRKQVNVLLIFLQTMLNFIKSKAS
jgi:hypothetical protein